MICIGCEPFDGPSGPQVETSRAALSAPVLVRQFHTPAVSAAFSPGELGGERPAMARLGNVLLYAASDFVHATE